MATRRIDAIISARDNATPVLAKVQGALGTLGSVAAAVGAVAIGRKLVQGFAFASDAAAKQEKAEVAVANSLRLVGESVTETLPAIREMAAGLQDITGVGDEVILKGQALLITMGKLTGEGLERATKAALDLASVTGNVDTAFDLVSKAASGYTSTLSRYGIIIDQNLPETEKFAAALEKIEEKFGGGAQAQLQTFTGRVGEAAGRIGDLAEVLGKPLNDASKAALTSFSELTKKATGAAAANSQLRDVTLDLAIAMAHLGNIVVGPTRNLATLAVVFGGLQLSRFKRDLEGVNTALALVSVATKTTNGPFTDMLQQLVKLKAGGGDVEKMFGELNDTLGDVRQKTEEVHTYASDLYELFADLGVTSTFDLVGAQLELVAQLEAARQAYEDGAIGMQDYLNLQEAIRLKSIELAEQADPFVGPPASAAGGDDDDGSDVAAGLAADLDAWAEYQQSRADIEAEFSEERQRIETEMLTEARDRELAGFEGSAAGRRAIEERTNNQILALDDKFTRGRLKLSDLAKKQQIEDAMFVVGAIGGALSTLFGNTKATAIANAIISTALGVARALELGPILGPPLAVLIAAAGAVQISKIQSTQPQRYAEGGFVRGGTPGVDSVPALLTPGELVLTEEQQAAVGGGGDMQVYIDVGPNLQRFAESVSVEVKRGTVNLVATELATARTVR